MGTGWNEEAPREALHSFNRYFSSILSVLGTVVDSCHTSVYKTKGSWPSTSSSSSRGRQTNSNVQNREVNSLKEQSNQSGSQAGAEKLWDLGLLGGRADGICRYSEHVV